MFQWVANDEKKKQSQPLGYKPSFVPWLHHKYMARPFFEYLPVTHRQPKVCNQSSITIICIVIKRMLPELKTFWNSQL